MEQEIHHFLDQLATVQERTLNVLTRKQELLAKADREGLAAIAEEEKKVLDLLKHCLQHREEILAVAKQRNLPDESIQVLCRQILPRDSKLLRQVEESAWKSRLIRFQSLTNWVMTQKSIIHLSQILEIIATRGQGRLTYHRKHDNDTTSGSGFVDRVA